MPFKRSKQGTQLSIWGADQLATALDLIYRGSKAASGHVSRRIREPVINRMVWQGDQA